MALSTTKISDKSTALNYVLFGLLALMWSGSFINIKIVVDALPPIFCATMRVLVSLIGLFIIFSSMKKKFLYCTAHHWKIWLAGLFTQAIPFGLLFYGEKFVAPALASILNSTVSIWALLLGACIFRDFANWTLAKMIGLLLGFFGIVLIFSPYVFKAESSMLGILSIMGMSISYALGGLINQHVIFVNKNITFESNLFYQHVASVFVMAVVSLSLESWPALSWMQNSSLVLAFLYLGLIATAIAWIIYFYLIREWGAVSSATVMYVVPLLAIVWDFLFLHIIPSYLELTGAAAILSGVILIQWVRKIPPTTLSFEAK